MPYESQAQSRFVHAKANEGEPWAKKFVADSQHGEGSVSRLPERIGKMRKVTDAIAKRRA